MSLLNLSLGRLFIVDSLREKPVWSIVIYTDDAVWRKQVPDRFWYAFDSRNKKQYHHFDVIKVINCLMPRTAATFRLSC